MIEITDKFDFSKLPSEIKEDKLKNLFYFLYLDMFQSKTDKDDYIRGYVLNSWKNNGKDTYYKRDINFSRNISWDLNRNEWVIYNKNNLNSLFKIKLDFSKNKYRKIILEKSNSTIKEFSTDKYANVEYDESVFEFDNLKKYFFPVLFKDLTTLLNNQIKKKYKETIEEGLNAVDLLKQSKITLDEFSSIRSDLLIQDINNDLKRKRNWNSTAYREEILFLSKLIKKETLVLLKPDYISDLIKVNPTFIENSDYIMNYLIDNEMSFESKLKIVFSFGKRDFISTFIKKEKDIDSLDDEELLKLSKTVVFRLENSSISLDKNIDEYWLFFELLNY